MSYHFNLSQIINGERNDSIWSSINQWQSLKLIGDHVKWNATTAAISSNRSHGNWRGPFEFNFFVEEFVFLWDSCGEWANQYWPSHWWFCGRQTIGRWRRRRESRGKNETKRRHKETRTKNRTAMTTISTSVRAKVGNKEINQNVCNNNGVVSRNEAAVENKTKQKFAELKNWNEIEIAGRRPPPSWHERRPIKKNTVKTRYRPKGKGSFRRGPRTISCWVTITVKASHKSSADKRATRAHNEAVH